METTKHKIIAWIVYSIFTMLILIPFYEIGMDKLTSLSILIGFFMAIINSVTIQLQEIRKQGEVELKVDENESK